MTLAERWNGTSWKIQPTPNPTGGAKSAPKDLSGVSCTSATACTAVGHYILGLSQYLTLAERWNGTTWTIQPTPNPNGQYSELFGLSCTSATACTAVGYHDGGMGVSATFSEQWNGSSWGIQAPPNPAGYDSFQLSGVSCTSAIACTAVGTYRDAHVIDRTLAERSS
jgi:hypothetical protein